MDPVFFLSAFAERRRYSLWMDDCDLLTEYSLGSEAAFATLVKRHLDAVYSVAYRVLGSHALAEEVAFSTFNELARSRVKPNTPLIAWLFCVARRSALDRLKSEQRRQKRETAALQKTELHHSSSPSDWADALDQGLALLKPSDRDILFLRFYEEQSVVSIAKMLQITPDAAQKRLERALNQLRSRLERLGIGPVQPAASLAAWAQLARTPAPARTLASILESIPAPGPLFSTSAGRIALMTTTQKSAATLILVALIGTPLFQQSRINRLRSDLENTWRSAEAAEEQLGRAQDELRRAQARQMKARQEHLELLSLRGRVQQVRDQLAQPSHAASAVRARSPGDPPADDSILFSLALTNQLAPGQSLVAGGWKTPGQRRYLLITPELHSEATNDEFFSVKSQMIAAPETFWSTIGWGEAASDQHRSTVTGLLQQDEIDALLDLLKKYQGSELSNVSVANRKEGDIIGLGFSVDDEAGNGMMCSLNAYPKLAPDGRSVIIEISPSDLGTNAPVHPSLRHAAR